MSALGKFLERNSATVGKALPIVHTTKAYFLKNIIDTNRVDVTYCDVFKERLAYFFVGRPAYKWETEGEAAEWELPVCLIFEYNIDGVKRIFPFDTGGYDRFPSYIKMMKRDEFEVHDVSQAPQRLIGTFFASTRDYYTMKPRTEHKFFDEFLVDMFDAEVKAVHRLMSNAAPRADDRRCAVELQFDAAFDLGKRKLLGVVAPDVYLEHEPVREFLRKKRATLYAYSVYTLNSAAYFAQIYDCVRRFYNKSGLLNV